MKPTLPSILDREPCLDPVEGRFVDLGEGKPQKPLSVSRLQDLGCPGLRFCVFSTLYLDKRISRIEAVYQDRSTPGPGAGVFPSIILFALVEIIRRYERLDKREQER